jgi:hypothetical protein
MSHPNITFSFDLGFIASWQFLEPAYYYMPGREKKVDLNHKNINY